MRKGRSNHTGKGERTSKWFCGSSQKLFDPLRYMLLHRSGIQKRMIIFNYIFQLNFTCPKYLIESIWENIYCWPAQKFTFCTRIQRNGALTRLCTVDVSSTLKLQKKRRLELIFTWKQQITQVNCLLLFLPNTVS